MGRADLLVRGRIATLSGEHGFGWVDAIAISGGRVVAAGSRQTVAAAIASATRTLDLPPDTVGLPGLVDAHLHLLDAALAEGQADLEGAVTLEDGLARLTAVVDRMPDADAWLEGGGWDPATWGRWPTAADLEAVAAGRRVALWSHDRHALWVSRRALAEAGIDAGTADRPGGRIHRDEHGRPSGVLQESAVAPVLARLSSRPDLPAVIGRFAEGLLRRGLVGVHDPGSLVAERALDALAAIATLEERGALPIRVHVSIREPALNEAIARGWRTGGPLDAALSSGQDGRARFGWLKLFADGALGSRTALLTEPYAGELEDRGIAVMPRSVLADLGRQGMAAGIVPEIHAIGDAALTAALDVLESLAPRSGPMARVEHVQLARAEDLPRFAAARIAASVQPIHLRSDRDKAHAAWGHDRAQRDAFRLRSLVRAGAVIALGTDAPVEPADPWPGLAIAVHRSSPGWSDPAPFGPAEALDLATAVRAATVGPGRIAGEPLGGRLVPGAPADLIAIPAAAMDDPVEPGGLLEQTHPSLVLVGGRLAHEA